MSEDQEQMTKQLKEDFLLSVEVDTLKDLERRYAAAREEADKLFERIIAQRKQIRKMTCIGHFAGLVYPVALEAS